jgi:hypothetical protein
MSKEQNRITKAKKRITQHLPARLRPIHSAKGSDSSDSTLGSSGFVPSVGSAMHRIFICYRRDDSIAYAGRLYDRLATHFGPENVFMDIDTLEPGIDFVEHLNQTVGSCGILIAVIGKYWLTATDKKGRPRLDDPEDFVRLEIAAALDRGIRVIPVLVADAHIPPSQNLPDPLTKLTRRQAIEIRDTAFHSDVTRLIDALEKVIVVDNQGRAAIANAAVKTAELSECAEIGSPSSGAQPGRSSKISPGWWIRLAFAFLPMMLALKL